MTRTTFTKTNWNSRTNKYQTDMIEIDPYEKQLLNTARNVLMNSPYLNQTKKIIIERLFDQIEETYTKEDFT